MERKVRSGTSDRNVPFVGAVCERTEAPYRCIVLSLPVTATSCLRRACWSLKLCTSIAVPLPTPHCAE